MIGSSSHEWRDDKYVIYGQLPAMAGILHGVCVDETGKACVVDMESDSSRKSRTLDPRGLLDVFILKGIILFKRLISQNPRVVETRSDELVFAFDRDGRVAYVAAVCERFPMYPLGSDRRSHLDGWAERHGWRSGK